MAFFKTNQAANQQLSQRQVLENKYASSRHNILLVVVFTVINLILLITNSNTYFLFSAYVPYFVADLGMFLGGKYPAEFYTGEMAGMDALGTGFFVATLVTALVIVVLYLLGWIFSKKKSGWMIFALVFFILDTAAMFLLNGISADQIIDVIFHAWVIISLASGISAYNKLKKLPEEPEEELVEAAAASPVVNPVDEEPPFPMQ